ncbi:hypothetical protein P8452_15067 [Trifolium repens]|nr:hypothetical protein P8452_15067 [Trifolium repens]
MDIDKPAAVVEKKGDDTVHQTPEISEIPENTQDVGPDVETSLDQQANISEGNTDVIAEKDDAVEAEKEVSKPSSDPGVDKDTQGIPEATVEIHSDDEETSVHQEHEVIDVGDNAEDGVDEVPISQAFGVSKRLRSSKALSELHHNFNGASIATSSSPERHLHRSFIFSRLEPYVQPTREITKIIKRKFVGCWANYGEIKKKDEVVVELWYKEFQRKYKWLPEMSTTLRRHLIIRLLICTPVQCIGYGRILTQGIGSLLKCVHNWKQHGIKIVGKASHKKKDSNVSPTCWALFQKTHKVKGDPSKWVSSKSEMVVVT